MSSDPQGKFQFEYAINTEHPKPGLFYLCGCCDALLLKSKQVMTEFTLASSTSSYDLVMMKES